MTGARRVIVGASGSPGSLRALRHAEDLARRSVATLTPVLAWEPGPVLVALASRLDDLLIVGAGRRGMLAWPSRGRVSRYCVSHALCPVLAVPPAILAQEGRGLHGWALRRRGLNVEQILRSDGGGIPA